jgi:virulence-associated protein VapD
MGLFSTTTIVRSTTSVTIDNSAVAAATDRVAKATDKVAKATDNVAKAVGDDRITISHSRYAELYNKGEKLAAAKKYSIELTTSALRVLIHSNEYKYLSGSSTMFSASDNSFYRCIPSMIHDDVFLVIDGESRTADLYRQIGQHSYDPDRFRPNNLEPIGIEEPFLMREEDGQVQMTGVEYKKAISLEREYDEVYSNIRNILPRLIFNMINPTAYFKLNKIISNISNGVMVAEELDGITLQYDRSNGINITKVNGSTRYNQDN